MRSDNPRVAVGNNSGNTSEYLDENTGEIKKLPAGAFVNQTLVKMARLEADKKEISTELRLLSKQFAAEGGTKFALGIIRRLQKMDPDEREAVLHEIDAYAAFMAFW